MIEMNLFIIFCFYISVLCSNKISVFKLATITIVLIIYVFWLIADSFTGVGINDSVYFHMLMPHEGASVENLTYYGFLIISLAISIFLLIYFSWRKRHNRELSKNYSFYVLFAIVLVTPFMRNFLGSINNLISEQFSSEDISNEYIINDNKLNSVDNIVFIYAESLERTFRNIDGINYLPNLTKIAASGLDFSNIMQMPGMGWTMAGMVNTQCSVPLAMMQANSGNNISSFLSGADCIASEFKKNGYYNEFIRGSAKEFAGGDKFLSQHGWDNQIDKQYFIDNNLIQPDDISGWGVNDDILLDFAWKRYEYLSSLNKKFMLSLLTVNTHAPEGVFLDTCDHSILNITDNKMLQSVMCSDQLISQFIKKIMSSKEFSNTTIVLVSDHLMMQSDASDLLNQQHERRNQFIIINGKVKPKVVKKSGSLLDVWPTIINIFDVNSKPLGFGVSLISDKESKIVNYFSEKMNLNPYLAFSKSLWHYPSLEDKITSHDKMVKIHETLFKLPLYGRLDGVNSITDIWFEAFAKNIQSLIESSSSRFFYANHCSFKNIENAVCLYIFNSKGVEKRVYGTSGLLQKETKNINNPLFDKNLAGVSMSPYNHENTSESGLYYNGEMYPLNRGINAFFLRGNKSVDAVENYDTCIGNSIDKHKIEDAVNNTVLLVSNDSFICDKVDAINDIVHFLGMPEIWNMGFREQIGVLYNKNKSQKISGKANEPLDLFFDIQKKTIYPICAIFDDCSNSKY